MRLITRRMTEAFYNRETRTQSNTQVGYYPDEDVSRMWLHGNLIATYNYRNRELRVRHSGWRSVTTKERLNGVLRSKDAVVYQRDHEWYIMVNERGVDAPAQSFDEMADANGWVSV